jgi:uncharacterized protein DUF6916
VTLESFSLETFTPLVGHVFRVVIDESRSLDLTLADAAPYGDASEAHARDGLRAPFSLIFTGPLQPVLAQATVPLEHADLGSIHLFLVPIGPEDGLMRYEAAFA